MVEIVVFGLMGIGMFGVITLIATTNDKNRRLRHFYDENLRVEHDPRCMTNTLSVEMRVSENQFAPAMCLITDDEIIFFNLKSKQKDIFPIGTLQWIHDDFKRYGSGKSGITFYFESKQRLHVYYLRMHIHTFNRLKDCTQRVLHTTVYAARSLRLSLPAWQAQQDTYGLWSLGHEVHLSISPHLLLELSTDDLIRHKLPLVDVHHIDAITITGRELYGHTLLDGEGIIRLYLTGATLSYLLPNYKRLALEISGYVHCTYEHIEAKTR